MILQPDPRVVISAPELVTMRGAELLMGHLVPLRFDTSDTETHWKDFNAIMLMIGNYTIIYSNNGILRDLCGI